MLDIAFERDEDFDTERHRAYREDGWIGGSYTEIRYFLSCLMRRNYFRTPQEVWEAAAKQFVSTKAPNAAWVTRSNYFHEFAVLILKALYRESELGQIHPIREEHRTERIARSVIAHADLNVKDLAVKLKTTVKQLERNSTAMLAHREFRRVSAEP